MENPSIKGKQNYLIQLIIYSCALEETNVEVQDACLSQWSSHLFKKLVYLFKHLFLKGVSKGGYPYLALVYNTWNERILHFNF